MNTAKRNMKPVEFVVEQYRDVLTYLKSRFAMYHLSNFFFRDVQYGIMAMLGERGVRVTYVEAEESARAFIEKMEREKIFAPIDRQTWVVRYPDFRTPVRVSAPPKAAAAPPAAAKPATAAAGKPAQAAPAADQAAS